MSDYDLVVIGGGINGAAIARDAAFRGLHVLLLEKNDFGSGTTSWSSRLIHGGLRYLEYGELGLVYESLHDRRDLLKGAPHLVAPLRIGIPIYANARRGRHLVKAGMLAYDLLSLGKELPGHDMVGRKKTLQRLPGLNPDGLRGAAFYYDGQVTFAERLVIENVIDAAALGAVVRNYSEVTDIAVDDAAVSGLTVIDRRSGRVEEIAASLIVNAGGPWVDEVLSGVDSPLFGDYVGGTKGSHVVLPRFESAPDDAIYVEALADGRPFFIIPWNDQILVGTTDIRFEGDPASARASLAEIDYLLDEVNRLFPAADLTRRDVNFTYSGVRPLPPQTDGPEGAITRRHSIVHHNDVAHGLYSVIGGKLTTFLSLAEDVLKRLRRDFDLPIGRDGVRERGFPGAGGETGLAVPDATASHLHAVYGGQARAIVELAEAEPSLAEIVCAESGAIAAEVVHAMRAEWASTIDDVMSRRLMLTLTADVGLSALPAVARVMAGEAGWSDAERAANEKRHRDYVTDRFLLHRDAAA